MVFIKIHLYFNQDMAYSNKLHQNKLMQSLLFNSLIHHFNDFTSFFKHAFLLIKNYESHLLYYFNPLVLLLL